MKQKRSGMNSLKHKGLSGFGIKVKGDVVRKWTVGEESSAILMSDFLKQLKESFSNNLYPIHTVDIIGYKKEDKQFYFEMPYIYADTLWTSGSDLVSEKEQIRRSLHNRTRIEVSGFKSVVTDELKRIAPMLSSRDMIYCHRIKDSLSLCSDKYLHGYAHGDFGFSNMFIYKDKIHMIDFSESFIYSPLMDIATLSLSMRNENVFAKHLDIETTVLNDFKFYMPQINILKKVKMLSWLCHAADIPWRQELIKMLDEQIK